MPSTPPSTPPSTLPPTNPRPTPAALVRLRLSDFRNFHALDWCPPAGRLLLTGPNGAGKTTLLEALYLAATTRSFRTAQLATCVRRGAAGFALTAVVGEHPARELELALSATERRRALDGKPSALAEHLAVLPVLAWSPADAQLFSGPPEMRRRFFDRGLVHLRPSLLESFGRYERAAAEKRALLLRRERRSLAAWNELLATHGAEIASARHEFAGAVGAELGRLIAAHAPELPPAELAYRPATPEALAGPAALAARLAAAEDEELARGRTLVGPHRDDFELSWDGATARQGASAGEKKILGLFLFAALGRRLAAADREPALLVDDADAELDRARLERAVAAFAGFSRLWLTSSRPAAWGGIPGLARLAVTPSGPVPVEGFSADA